MDHIACPAQVPPTEYLQVVTQIVFCIFFEFFLPPGTSAGMAVRGGLRWRVGSVPGSPFVVAGLAMAACWLARPAPDGGAPTRTLPAVPVACMRAVVVPQQPRREMEMGFGATPGLFFF